MTSDALPHGEMEEILSFSEFYLPVAYWSSRNVDLLNEQTSYSMFMFLLNSDLLKPQHMSPKIAEVF